VLLTPRAPASFHLDSFPWPSHRPPHLPTTTKLALHEMRSFGNRETGSRDRAWITKTSYLLLHLDIFFCGLTLFMDIALHKLLSNIATKRCINQLVWKVAFWLRNIGIVCVPERIIGCLSLGPTSIFRLCTDPNHLLRKERQMISVLRITIFWWERRLV